MTGFNDIKFSEVQTISATQAVKQFKFLRNYNPLVYIRKERLTSAEIEQYTLALTVPKTATESYIRIFDPLVIVVIDGVSYLVNGNGRLETIAKLLKTSQLEIFDIPYVIIEGDINDDLLKRLQINYNDSTRKHKTLERLRMFHNAIDIAIMNGSVESDARKIVADFYGIKQMTLTHSRMIFDEPNENLIALIEEETISTDTATHIIRTSKKYFLTIEDVIDRVKHSARNKKSLKISQSDFTKWLKSFEEDLTISSQRNLEQIVKPSKTKEVLRFTENATVDPAIAVDETLESIDQIPTIAFSVDKIRTLAGILGTIGSHLSDDDSLMLFNKLSALTADFCTKELPSSLKAKLQDTLNKLAE